MDVGTLTWATLITMRMLHYIAAFPSDLRIIPPSRVPSSLSSYDDLLTSVLKSWDQGHPQNFLGYYTYSVPLPSDDDLGVEEDEGQMDPPTNLTLRYDRLTGAVNGEGRDLAGHFMAVGRATREGFILLYKEYAGYGWFWKGVILNWGIAGLWGDEGRLGLFYLWRADGNNAIGVATG